MACNCDDLVAPGGSRMMISRRVFISLAVFWSVLIPVQYYFMYKKFDAVSVCQDQYHRLDAVQEDIDKTQARIDALKKKD
jgi:hypothetical protein